MATRRFTIIPLLKLPGPTVFVAPCLYRLSAGSQPNEKYHHAACLTRQRAIGAEDFLPRRYGFPTKLREQPDRGLLDELVLGVGEGSWQMRAQYVVEYAVRELIPSFRFSAILHRGLCGGI